MPHFIASKIVHPSYPLSVDGYCFSDLLRNLDYSSEELVRVLHEGREFFLRIKYRVKEGDILVRFDKSTRISPVGIIKKALRLFAQKSEAKILSSNLNSVDSPRQRSESPFLKTPDSFMRLLERNYWLEIGFGSGRHLLHQAQTHRDREFIGLEIHTPSIEQVLRRIELMGLDNISIVSYDARVFLELLPSNSIERVFIHFPVPWDKKPHRRVFSAPFLSEVLRVLKRGGSLELRSDSLEYFHFVTSLLLSREHVEFCVRKNRDAAIASKYEERWRRQNKDIYDLLLHNYEVSEERARGFSFAFPEIRARSAEIQKEIHERWFVNLEYRYASENGDKMAFRSSFGDFAYPEKKYIWCESNHARYFNTPPIPTEANHLAHKRLCEWLA